MKTLITVAIIVIFLYIIAESYVRLVIDPWLKEADLDNDGVHKPRE